MSGMPIVVGYILFLLSPFLPILTQIPDNPASTGQISVVTSSLNNLTQLNAGFLIPNSYNNVLKTYAKYTRVLRDGTSSRQITKVYSEFEVALELAHKKLERVHEVLMIPLQKRADAQQANAPTIASDLYESAEQNLARAILKLEENRISEAFTIGQQAAISFEEARKSVIELSLVGPAKIGLSEAFKKDWDELAPLSFGRARRLMDAVTNAVDRGEPISSELQKKANDADYSTRKAIEIAAQIDTLRRNLGNWEGLLLSREHLVQQTADHAGLTTNFLADDPQGVLSKSLNRMTEEKDSLVIRIRRSETEAELLSSAVDSLNQAIEQQQIRLSSMVEDYQQDLQRRKEELEKDRRELKIYLYEKIQLDAATQAKTRFSDREAIVVRKLDQLTLHLIGISFAAGKTSIPPKAIKLLTKLGEFVALYPKTRITVEGHTDSTGKEAKNISLSKSRAEAIMRFLTDQLGVSEERMAANGFGSSRPIASNNTRDGRVQNRRIDLVISFSNVP